MFVRRQHSSPHTVWLFALLLFPVLTSQPAAAQTPTEGSEAGLPEIRLRSQEEILAAYLELPPRYQQWVQGVGGLITRAELNYFLDQSEDFRRDAFIEAFWRVRDPEPRTADNEMKQRWEALARSAGGVAPMADARFMLFLLNGSPGRWALPNGQPIGRCFSRSRELELWFYNGSERTERRIAMILLRRTVDSPYEAWKLNTPLRPIQRTGELPTTDIRALCADELLSYALDDISRLTDYDSQVESMLAPPLPPSEWLATFVGSTTDLPVGAATFETAAEISFPGRNQSRTAIRTVLTVSRDDASGRLFGGVQHHDFRIIGEVIRGGQLFESFRYRFDGPTPPGEALPLGFVRYLRPGEATLRVLLHDVYGDRYARIERELDIPSPSGLAAMGQSTSLAAADGEGPSLRLYTPLGSGALAGKVRFRARAIGEMDKVTFYVDDRPQLSKRLPPYSVELDLGDTAEPHRIRVVGFIGDREAATDQIWINQAAKRFRVRIVEPRTGGIYPGSLTARLEVDTPDGQAPERVELYLNDELVTTLTEAPYVQPLLLADRQVAVVRAVAHLADGNSAEEAVLINAAGAVEAIDVRLVEVYARVLDGNGQPIRGLTRESFELLDEGVPQELQEFAWVEDAALHTALVIDRSASMRPRLRQVTEAARDFAETALDQPGDRLAVVSFSGDATLDQGFTDRPEQIERALASLVADGGTALWDGIFRSLRELEGIRGGKALVLFSDGLDENSRLPYEAVLGAARASGTTLFVIGLEAAFKDRRSRRVLEDLALETGGQAYFLADLEALQRTYRTILDDLRGRYLLAYSPSATAGGYRRLEVKVDRRGVEVRARRGYVP